jgi:hypothetical protein
MAHRLVAGRWVMARRLRARYFAIQKSSVKFGGPERGQIFHLELNKGHRGGIIALKSILFSFSFKRLVDFFQPSASCN